MTLIELAVASLLGALVGLAAVVLLARGMTGWRRTDAQLQQLFAVERGLEMLGRDLRNAVASADRPFEGTATGLHFAAAEGESRLMEVGYRLEGEPEELSLIRQWRPFEEKEEPFLQKTLFTRVQNFSLEYAVLPPEGEGRGSFRWSPQWKSAPGGGSLPQMIRLQCRVQGPQAAPALIVREFWIPQGVIPVEAGEP